MKITDDPEADAAYVTLGSPIGAGEAVVIGRRLASEALDRAGL